MAQWLKFQLGTIRLWVRSLAFLSGFQHCAELWFGSKRWLKSNIPVAVAYAGGYSSD